MPIFREKTLYTYKFIGQCLPIYAFYTILFLERGKTITDVAILIAFWSVCTIFFEIPSGILADRWNRRNMLAIAAVLQALCFVVWFFSHTFLHFAVGFAFWALSGAFTSGTEEGLIYDNLKSDGQETRFTEVYGKAQFYANIGTIVGIATAGIIASVISVAAIALLSAGICLLNAIFALQIREKNSYTTRPSDQTTTFWGTLQEASGFVKNSKLALLSISFLVLFASLGNYLDEFDAIIINDFQLSHIWVSVILTVRFAFVALGDILAPMVEKKITSIRQIFLLNALACAVLAVFALVWNQFAIPIFGFAFLCMAITEILLVNALQGEIKEEGRATVLSFYSIGQNIAMICLTLIYALLAGVFALQQVYLILSIYGILGGVVFCLLSGTIKRKI